MGEDVGGILSEGRRPANIRKRRRRRIAAICAAVLVMGIGYVYWVGYQQMRKEEDASKLLVAVGSTLIAIRDGDSQKLQATMYSGSGDMIAAEYAPRAWRKIMENSRKELGLKSLSDVEIYRSLGFPESQSILLNTSILRWSVDPHLWPDLREHPVEGVLVKASLPRHAVVVLCVRERGTWKVVGFPGVSAKVLRYRTIDEASRHNAVIVE